MQTFKGSFRAQTMPITRSKQLVGAQEFPKGVIHASSKSRFLVVRLVLKFLQTFKSSFRAQTMPITRSKQLVGTQEFPMGVIHASLKSRF